MLPRENRLNLAKEFGRFKKYGCPYKTPYFTILGLKETGGDSPVGGPRMGFVVSNKLGKAAVRNRIRRLLREIVRPLVGEIPAKLKIVIIALPPILKADPGLVKNEIGKALKNIKFRLESNNIKL